MRFQEEVRRGAALLDEKEPGWRDRIAPGALKMDDCRVCIVGQVLGLEGVSPTHYLKAHREYQRVLDEWGLYDFRSEAAHGFIPTGSNGWNDLREAWLGYIKGEWS